VCVSPDDPCSFFLYEVYNDRAGFDAHLASAHYQRFDQLVQPWIASKDVRFLQRIED
jgi:(4S)-4-hydroxy-5-phosphonooxypentane-2,3-dione isomerase